MRPYGRKKQKRWNVEKNHEVRMILWDYDAAPDGDSMYEVVNAIFPSVSAALRHRDQMWGGDLCWGYIQDADGRLIETLRTRYEEEDLGRQSLEDEYDWWGEHTATCDGCYQCDPLAYPDEGD